jgi:hypothetical protein
MGAGPELRVNGNSTGGPRKCLTNDKVFRCFKTGCWSTVGLIASNDGGASWHPVKLPS